jgi:hypothetical protein
MNNNIRAYARPIFEEIAGICVLGYFLFIAYSILTVEKDNNTLRVLYDCRLAEISVDYPQQVKEQCRKLMK